MKQEEKIWEYLSYATLKDVGSECKNGILAWVFISVVVLLVGGAFDIGTDAAGMADLNQFTNILPRWLWIGLLFAAGSWLYRGQELKFVVPRLGFGSWLFLSILVVGIAFAYEHFEWWLITPIVVALLLFTNALDNLALKGKANFEAGESDSDSRC